MVSAVNYDLFCNFVFACVYYGRNSNEIRSIIYILCSKTTKRTLALRESAGLRFVQLFPLRLNSKDVVSVWKYSVTFLF
jgi:hypothetical protein